jgi:hypothetical protein
MQKRNRPGKTCSVLQCLAAVVCYFVVGSGDLFSCLGKIKSWLVDEVAPCCIGRYSGNLSLGKFQPVYEATFFIPEIIGTDCLSDVWPVIVWPVTIFHDHFV